MSDKMSARFYITQEVLEVFSMKQTDVQGETERAAKQEFQRLLYMHDLCAEAVEVISTIHREKVRRAMAGAYAAAAKQASEIYRHAKEHSLSIDEAFEDVLEAFDALTPADARQAQTGERMECGHLKAEWVARPRTCGPSENCDCKTHGYCRTCAAIASAEARARLERPKIICLCGSTRFIEQFAIITWEMERAGFIVLGCTLLPQWYCKVPSHFGEATGTKEQCDELHKRKIDLADEILVLNVGGYIGESTRSEIEYAMVHGKTVRYLEAAARTPDSTKEPE